MARIIAFAPAFGATRYLSQQQTTTYSGSFQRTPLQMIPGLSFDPPSSHLVISADTLSDASSATAPAGVYEAIIPPTETLLGYGLIVVLCVGVGWVWANQVVPASRTNLAISKSRGEVKEYLDELKASDPEADSKNMQTESAEDDLGVMTTNPTKNAEQDFNVEGDNRGFERWLFTDWLQDNKSARKAGRQKEPALPVLKDAKWNSGDNPVLAATALISLGVLFTAVTERVVSH